MKRPDQTHVFKENKESIMVDGMFNANRKIESLSSNQYKTHFKGMLQFRNRTQKKLQSN